MPQPSRSPQLPKPAPSEPLGIEAQGDRPAYQIRGLAPADEMPIDFGGTRYDLRNLSTDELALLIQHPEQVPYLLPG